MGLVATRLFLVAALLGSCVAGAQSVSCIVADAELQGSYTGACVNGRADGYGEARGSAAQFRGEFKAGLPHGKGVKTWPSDDHYEGDFVEGRKEGTGMYVWGRRSQWAGHRYTGGWLKDRRHGYGVYELPNGERYAGPWENDRFVGKPTASMVARARMFAEHAAAVGRVGARVCRELELGVGVRDTVRGTVMEVDGDRVVVRIDDSGKLDHTLNDRPVRKGAIITDALKSWSLCAP